MKRDIFKIFVLFLTVMLAFSSCSVPELYSFEAGGTLPREDISEPTTGLLDPGAEVRGIWIATVGNINFPSKKGLSADKLKAELRDIVASCTRLGLNTVFFQVRPTADALYDSELFPASEYVSGKQGKSVDGDFDCLEYLLDIAHREKINVHAWVNPLRVTYGSAKYPRTDISELSDDSPARKNPSWVIPYADGKLYFDPGNPDVRDYVALGVREIAENYEVDGIVFDDYFYPYPVEGASFDDSASYASYGSGKDIGNWRRENINSLVKQCYETVKSVRETCLFGISPFGIWQNDDGENGGSATRGLESYESLYCDTLAWAEGGYVDYISPQLYWSFDTEAAPYGVLSDWWNSVLDGTGVKLIISHGVYRYEENGKLSGELTRQINYSREALCYRGSMLYGYKALEQNSLGVGEEISEAFSGEIIYSDYFSDGERLMLTGIPDGSAVSDSSIIISGDSDPTKPVELNGRRVSRNKDGTFKLTLSLGLGENIITVTCGDEEKIYKTVRE